MRCVICHLLHPAGLLTVRCWLQTPAAGKRKAVTPKGEESGEADEDDEDDEEDEVCCSAAALCSVHIQLHWHARLVCA